MADANLARRQLGKRWQYSHLILFLKGPGTMFIAVLLFCSPIANSCVVLSTEASFGADIECSAKIRETVEVARDKMPSFSLRDAGCRRLVGFSI